MVCTTRDVLLDAEIAIGVAHDLPEATVTKTAGNLYICSMQWEIAASESKTITQGSRRLQVKLHEFVAMPM